VVKQITSGFAVAGIDNPLFYADPTSMLRRRPTERREVTDELKAV
jgi:NAD/NADP transhydrogenase beta subunit